MKLAFTKTLGKVVSIGSGILILLSLLGIFNLTFPEYFEFVANMFGFDKEAMTVFTLGAAGTGTLGLVGRTLKNSYNTQNALLIATHSAERSKWQKEKEEYRLELNDFIVDHTLKHGEEIELLNKVNDELELAKSFNVAYAKERLNMSDNLVPQEIKSYYKGYLDKVLDNDNKETVVEPLIVSEEVEKIVEVELTPKEVKLKNKKNNKGVGVR